MKLDGKSMILGMISFVLTVILSAISSVKQRDAVNAAVDRRLLELANASRKEDKQEDVIDANGR